MMWPFIEGAPQMLIRFALLVVVAAAFGSRPASAQQVTKQTVPGVQNFAKLETTVACGGATTPEAVPELKKMGYASIINLRLPSEAGANVEGEAAAARTAGIHCAAGNRAGAMWMIKRLVVDHWDTDKAFTEATALGLTSPALKQFAIDYAQSHKR